MMESRTWRLSKQLLTPAITVGGAALLTHGIPSLQNHSSLFLFLAAVIISTRLGGWGAGLVAIVLSSAVTAYYFLRPGYSFRIEDPADVLRLIFFVLVALVVLSLHAARGKSERALVASEQRLMLALDSACLGVWDYNLLTRQFWWSKTLETIYGRTTDFPTTYGRFFGYIHFDDQPIFNRAITRTIDEGTDYAVDHRIILPDQSIRWVNTRGRVFFNEKSRAERIVGVTVDITANRKMERQQDLSRQAVDETRLSTVA